MVKTAVDSAILAPELRISESFEHRKASSNTFLNVVESKNKSAHNNGRVSVGAFRAVWSSASFVSVSYVAHDVEVAE